MISKSKVTPDKKLSIPRLEIYGSLLLARGINYMCSNLTSLWINRIIAWSESIVALSWTTSKVKTFVANFVAQIQHITSLEIWRHVPTALNPVDRASRGLTPGELVNQSLWWTGPDYLKEPEESWPIVNSILSAENERNKHVETNTITLVSTPKPPPHFRLTSRL